MISPLKASFYTLGCRLNQAETALIRGKFEEQGYQTVPFTEKSDICVINSCTVTENADSKCRQLVRQLLRRNPQTYVAIVGCYSQTSSESLSQIEGIDLIVGTQEKLNVLQFIDEPLKQVEPRIVRSTISRKPFTIEANHAKITTTRVNLKIQDGCDFMCSFCVIPFARGRARSRAFWDIQREAQQLVDAGYKELVLTGVNIGTYQFEGKNFIDIIQMLLKISGIERLRISSIEPTTIPVELLDIMAETERLCSHLHIPLQSGSNKILENMKRRYNVNEYLEFIEVAAQKVPDVLLATDIIVGFPGETEEDFLASCNVLEQSPLSYAHVFTFSQREGTGAARLDNKLEPREKKMRSKHIQQVSQQQKQKFYTRFNNKTLRILTEECDREERWLGFSDNYIKVAVNAPQMTCNQLIDVKLSSFDRGVMVGEVA